MSIGQQNVDSLVCYCYEVTEERVRGSIDTFGLQTVEEIGLHTNAGSGCTACHCRIRRLLAGLPATCGALETCDTCGFAEGRCRCKVAALAEQGRSVF